MYGYLIIRTDNSVELVESVGYKFTLDEMYKAINCDSIDIVKVRPNHYYYMCCDDNAIWSDKKRNLIATLLYGDFIFGDVILGNCELPFDEEPDMYKMPLEDCLELKADIESLDL